MSSPKKSFYITTAIDYPNGKPHLGHAYEKIVSDAYARWYRFLGKDVWFLTGLDENGQKLSEKAKELSLDTKDFIDEQEVHFKDLCNKLLITNNDFIRTTEKRHFERAQKFWEDLKAKGDIYFSKYGGNYCLQCENFYTKIQAPDNKCPDHGTDLEFVEEEGYFFKLSEYQDWIKKTILENEQFIVPSSARKEVLSRIDAEPIRDLAISRPNGGWGIPVPGDDKFVMYTWFDALINYQSALDQKQMDKYWPCDMHVIGKDIIWFHCIIWPSILKALDLKLPEQVFVHGMVLAADGRKMSKSLNNGADPFEMVSKYPIDTFRYYLLRHIPSGADGKFSEVDMVDRHNGELANDYGNLLSRVVKLSLKNLPETVDGQNKKQEVFFDDIFNKMKTLMDQREHNKAIDALWSGIYLANQYVNDMAPWKLKEDKEKLSQVVYNSLYSIHMVSQLLKSFLPNASMESLTYLGIDPKSNELPVFGETVYKLTEPSVLFPKFKAE